jgi:hypothetical protein
MIQDLSIDGWFWFRPISTISLSLVAQGTAALFRDHGWKETDDLGEQAKAMLGDGFSRQVPGFVAPIATLPGRASAVLVESRTVLAGATRVAVREIGADGAQSPMELV